jgi:hypothetical protein
MWFAIGVVAVVVLIIGVLLRSPRATSGDGPLPPDVEAQVLLGEDPDPSPPHPAADDESPR